MILAFDLATTTGVAYGSPGSKPVLMTESLAVSNKMQGAKFLQAFKMTQRLITEHRPRVIAIEAALAQGGGGSANRVQVTMGIRACVHACAFSMRVPVFEFAVQTVRKHFILNGKLAGDEAKRKVFMECLKRGWEPASDHESDAAAVWDLCCSVKFGKASAVPGSLFDGR